MRAQLASPPTGVPLPRLWTDPLIAGALALATLCLYLATLLPDIGAGDIAEFQRAAPTLGLPHPTGYPLYLILGWLWTHLPLGGTVAWRMNLLSAVFAAGANGALYLCGRELGQGRVIAAAAALAQATGITFWKQATIAEVYALAALLQLSLFLSLWRWRRGRAPLALVGALCGLALVHHRTAVFFLPGVALFIGLTRWPTRRELLWAGAALCAAGLIYLYVPLRVAPELRTWPYVWDYITGRNLASFGLDIGRLWREGPSRLLDLAQRHILLQLLAAGAALSLLGVARIMRDRASAALLLSTYVLIVLFSAAYYVFDVEVFLLPAHTVAALLLGEGAMLLVSLLTPRGVARPELHAAMPALGTLPQPGMVAPRALLPAVLPPALGALLLLLPLTLAPRNAPLVQAANRDVGSLPVRVIMAQPLPYRALLIVDWWYSYEELLYLQQVEGARPDLELLPAHSGKDYQGYIEQALDGGRAVYLLRAQPDLPLRQSLEGMLWRVRREPAELMVDTPIEARWSHGVALTGYAIVGRVFRRGEVVPITLAWRAARPIERHQTVFIHLVGPDGAIWGQQDYAPIILTGEAAPEQTRLDLAGPLLNRHAPPGTYRINLGWYDGSSLRRFGLVDADGRSLDGDFITLGEIEVAP